MRNWKQCFVFVICNLTQTRAEAGEEGRGSSCGVLCVRPRFQTLSEGKALMGFNQRSGIIRLTYSMACYISVEQKISNFVGDAEKKSRLMTFQHTHTHTHTHTYPDSVMQ